MGIGEIRVHAVAQVQEATPWLGQWQPVTAEAAKYLEERGEVHERRDTDGTAWIRTTHQVDMLGRRVYQPEAK